MIDIQPVKGTRDFFPEDMQYQTWLFDLWRQTAHEFGFEEYDACVLEKEELYIRKAGDEITDQLYNFSDKGNRRVSLRPEMTPSLARMILQRQKSLSFPIKWFSVAQCFRYERMTKGRRREHFQWNADIVGQSMEVAEAEIFSMIISFCQKAGLTSQDVSIYLNDRRILNSILAKLGVEEERHAPILIVMDKRDKLPEDAFKELLREEKMQETQIDELYRHLSMTSLDELSRELPECPGIENLNKLFKLMEQLQLGSFFKFDVSIVRGLSYYTGTVFEMNDTSKSQRAICGGGRYDSLLATYGGDHIPAVGFGFGDVVFLDVLRDLDRLPKQDAAADYAIIPFSQQEAPDALKIAQHLRNHGKRVHCNFSFKKLKRTLQQASESKVPFVILLFPDELAEGNVVLRNMETREETVTSIETLASLATPS